METAKLTALFLTPLALLGFLMKLAALLVPGRPRETNWAFLLSPLLSPNSLRRSRPISVAPRLALRTALLIGAVLLAHWLCERMAAVLHLRGIGLSYLAAPLLYLVTEAVSSLLALLWLPSGRVLPDFHAQPWRARGLAEFWGQRWNLWFSDWFRYVVFVPCRRRPQLALVIIFALSGLMHEGCVNVPLFFLAGRNRFGSMMIYFLLQGAGVMLERRFLRHAPRARRVFVWVMVLGPVPLNINEGILWLLQLGP